MVCSKCGNAVSDDSNFCGKCGTKIQKEIFCTVCGHKLTSGVVFCTNCGTKKENGNTVITIKEKQSGRLLREMKGITKFFGEPTVGVANKLGILRVYDNKVEFERKAGLTIAGTINALKNSEVETYYYSDCTSVTTGTYMMAYVTLVLNLKNGKKISFCPAIPVSRDMETVADLILHYV